MAFSLATEANARTVLIDGNLSTPRIHELFNINKSPGLTDVLYHGGNLDEIIQRTEFSKLNIIASGSEVAKKLDFFETDHIKKTLETLKQNFDYVVVDGQSVSGASDISIISRYFDGILFVVECERTRWEVLQQAKEKIQSVGGKILGVVLNRRKYYIPQKLYAKV
jgi:capsular exopolysaccharide synthesis family protein